MVDLSLYGTGVDSVFDLLGRNENDLTAALAFTLVRAKNLMPDLLTMLDGPPNREPSLVRLETSDDDGRTDLEIDFGDYLLIVEAKRGLRLPSSNQLDRYSARILSIGSGMLVTLSAAPINFARFALPDQVNGVEVKHVPWSWVLERTAAPKPSESRSGRRWLKELNQYLRKAIFVTDPASSWALCVSVSRAHPGGGGAHRLIDFVVEQDIYFHPYGVSGWPIDPPNFLAFRWDGAVQQIRRVMTSDVIPNLQVRWPDIPHTEQTDRPHALYGLGPPLPMDAPVPSGTNYRAARLWVLVDQILTRPTLKEALEGTRALTS